MTKLTLLQINNLEIEFPSRKSVLRAVDNVSLSLEKGDILGIVGESGAGKSTVGNALIGLLEGFKFVITILVLSLTILPFHLLGLNGLTGEIASLLEFKLSIGP